MKIVIICSVFLITIDAYRILMVHPLNSKSHAIFLDGVSKALANRGHQIDAISHFELKNPPQNYKTIINLNGTLPNLVNNFTIEYAAEIGDNIVPFIANRYGSELCNLMALDEMQKLIKNPPKDPSYDLVITEAFGSNCYIGLGYVLKVPVITISSCLEYSWIGNAVGNPDSIAFAPDVLMDAAEISTFWDRLKNAFVTYYSRYQFHKYTRDVQTIAMRKYLSPEIPDIRQVEKSVALTFVNSFYTLFGIRIRTPALVDIAGVHIEENDEKLSPELEKWMDESKNGVVYFTLGSMILIETLPKETLLAFYASFAKIAPIRVLIKIVNKEKLPPGLPKNILPMKWIPQIPVLRHENTKLFITHGGLIGTQEALYYGIPMIGMPVYGDQFTNMRIFVKKNMALQMDYRKITRHSLDNALDTVLNNPLYRESAKKESELFRDRPISAGDMVDFWVRYVIRNGGNSLRSPALNLHWWQVQLIDIYGFIVLSIIIVVLLIIVIIKFACRKISKCSKNKRTRDKEE